MLELIQAYIAQFDHDAAQRLASDLILARERR